MLLAIAAEQEEYLGLEGVSGAVTVKIGEKRILLENFEQQFGLKTGLQQAGQGGLANADDPFNGNVHETGSGGGME